MHGRGSGAVRPVPGSMALTGRGTGQLASPSRADGPIRASRLPRSASAPGLRAAVGSV
jgi:hypothetical protein